MLQDRIRKIAVASVLMVLLFLIGSCQIASAMSSVSVSPQTITASAGDTFSVDIIVDPAGSGVYGADCKLRFDSTILNATSQTGGTFLDQGGADTIEVQNSIDNTAGMVRYGETRIGDPEVVGSATEKGMLATITFEAIGSGTTDIKLESKLSDSSVQLIDVTTSDGTCSVSGDVVAEERHTPDKPAATSGQMPKKPESMQTPGFGAACLIIGLIGALLMLRMDR